MMDRKRLITALAWLGAAVAASPAMAEELQVRSGVVTSILAEPAPARTPPVVDARQKRELGGMLGRALGQATGSDVATANLLGRLAADVAGNSGQGRVADAAPDGYTLVVRFDDATEAAFTKTREHLDRIRVGTRVRVVGSGRLASLAPEEAGGSGVVR